MPPFVRRRNEGHARCIIDYDRLARERLVAGTNPDTVDLSSYVRVSNLSAPAFHLQW